MDQTVKISHSEEIKDFVAALAKAQGSIKPAVFNKVNPHFKSRYADFASCMEACRLPLSENGIATIQYCETVDGKINLVTMLAHVSGQWMKSEFPLISAKMDSQGIGSAMTYAKRYSLCGMVGIVADEEEDDDGEAAMGRGKNVAQKSAPKEVVQKKEPQEIKKITDKQVAVLKTLEEKLDEECKQKLYSWLNSSYNINCLEDVAAENFSRVFSAFENALRFMEQQKALEQKPLAN